MKKWLLLLAVAGIATLPLSIQAQVNNYFPDVWKDVPQLHSIPSANEPYTILDYRVVRDFNIGTRERAQSISHYKTLYKIIRINTQRAADSLTRLVMAIEPNEALRSMRIRLIHPNGEVTALNDQVRMIDMNDDRKAIVANNLVLQAGCEIEYELNLKILFDYGGTEYFQSGIPTSNATFLLVAPKAMEFTLKASPGLAALTDSSVSDRRYYSLHQQNIPPLENNDLYFYLPQLKRIDFGLKQAIEGKDTARLSWQQFGDQRYIPIVAISKNEYKQLEKEVRQWPFTSQRLPLPQMIYLVEQYVKSNYVLTGPSEGGETSDISFILRTKRADKQGMTRFISGAYYILGIPTQVLFTTSRDSILMDPQILYPQLPSHVLLYFPSLQQALAPTEMDTRFPCYPSLWAAIPALRCRDTLVDGTSKVLTDFIQTPLPAYTLSNITTEATLRSVTDPTWEVKQSFGGYPGSALKTAFSSTGSTPEGKLKVFNAILPFEPGMRKPTNVKVENEVFNNRTLDKPVVLTSTLLTTSSVENTSNSIIIHVGPLLGGNMPTDATVPPGDLPIQVTFPYYQEKRIIVPIPAGFKVVNKEDFTAEIIDKSNDPALGFKMRCEQDGNELRIFVLEWYKQTDYTGASKAVFAELLKRIHVLQQQQLILSK
ncbi:DUF3857 domain-containing protein [Chitinophaga arvensicola]|uniref:DUF3857 domain-containing protein n=1 Tax=Chitinophaga arvensicola TaxID=29529 RepID=A0A1I0R0Q9_9BACT|nr:DUF3857 domain-containing protein [Chitinophaga arvensicola]SEW33681.1 protein of unknown function [Chitinophaga arvensicola]